MGKWRPERDSDHIGQAAPKWQTWMEPVLLFCCAFCEAKGPLSSLLCSPPPPPMNPSSNSKPIQSFHKRRKMGISRTQSSNSDI